MDRINAKIILASTRENRFGDKPAAWIDALARRRTDVEVELIDLRDWPLPFYDEALPPIALGGRYTQPLAKKWADKIREGDAFVIVTPEYNHGYPAVLKNALDWIYFEWTNKPVAFISWGSVDGARCVEQLRLVAVELQMAPIRNALHVPDFMALTNAGGDPKAGAFDALEKPARILLDQLVWWAKALKAARAEGTPPFM